MNMIKKISGVAAGVALAFGLAAPASAGVTLVSGDYKITFNAYDAGTVGYVPGATTTICNTTASCDAVVVDTDRDADALPDTSPYGVGSEDTWGIFSVQTITNIKTGDAFFTRGVDGFLIGMFGGLADQKVDVFGMDTAIAYANGGWLNMYLTSQDYDPTIGPDGRLGAMGYQGVTNQAGGILALSAEFAGTARATQPGYSYYSSFQLDSIFGNGAGYLDVTGGAWADAFDQNSVKDALGNTRDMSLKATYQVTNTSKLAGWTVDATGDVQGNIPEPGSLALLGLGFAGLAGLRRRRAAK
ncbi:PEP-CTERM sorting domain-containing protein [Massilia sp. LjRoot122]|uniref:PEP-CTERM sorting domain-containing protein n=1 Tax=Massilia sp. LjRoot122 TaxID=3342257 RepID=UPI003ECFEAB0